MLKHQRSGFVFHKCENVLSSHQSFCCQKQKCANGRVIASIPLFYPLITAKETTKPVKSLNVVQGLFDEIANDGVPAVSPTGEDIPTPPQFTYLKIVEMPPLVFHPDLPMNPCTKEDIDDFFHIEYGLLDGEEVPQIESCENDIKDLQSWTKKMTNKLIQSILDFLSYS